MKWFLYNEEEELNDRVVIVLANKQAFEYLFNKLQSIN